MPRLIVLRGVDEGKQFDLTGSPITVGRHSSNEVALHDTQVSRRHLELRAAATGYQLKDLGSGNGTLLNGRATHEAALRSGDTISIGQTVMMYTAGRHDSAEAGNDLTERVRLVPNPDPSFPSAVVRTIPADAGSQILARPNAAATDWLRTRLASLAALYETAEAVSHILDVDQLLATVMELVLRSVNADHGCFMLRGEGGALEPRAVRYRDGVNRAEELAVSRTIVDQVLRDGQGVLVSDVHADSRFRGVESLHKHNIREAICVPMKGRREAVGVLFLDTQSTLKQFVSKGQEAGKFNEDHLTLASAIAHQAAIAVEESRYHQALVNAERLAAVGQTIAAMSHHIKNIMQGVRFGADMVRTALKDDDRDLLAKGWKLVERNQTRIDELILDMLSYSKEREPAVEPTDLNKLCEDVLEMLRGRAEARGVTLEWRAGTGVAAVPCDPDGIHRAVLNIVSNAVDAVEDRPNPKVAVQAILEPAGDWAKVIVVDNGPGIPAEIVEEVFKPFVSTKGSRGTGLGLPVSRKILREHGGDIVVQSVIDKGSKFSLRIPMKSAFAADASGGTVPHPSLKPPEAN
ncbi:sensor protein atos : Signal transduction histidine kinase OS=Singulisphaera acidiphila (strain ATCC BAA-1392 / DSM 18658 / VKM B-2454 / MOB10) GN=Sinac_1319 PE=4 SV=1: FHA: GAF: HATPase_c [Gemmataceae bacterium]|nr:sensor protein atos : Signal transduction histidine kinase OS=Singulisphaera acidiphila (strain ATCC BAA-1392 / DSM 18658 / VKM B-2454 / MOB10) GN=Sinac_1319 PE=4 SV=1: FHA: GAF: HATPase_c [Gemmataceae bacterium]VTT96736.1 sensor protein atos : Signal transduction histidine kinase OS=Singulisphaera acidiphila (strain ATCC BAA-1392 / DSM 18658 / VKM B-2454 / MOB10) GN=Sinac_1319 PE=4 SV=1: FHA: GAF: HATPase_c [Gemmataceae bacterium]